MPRKQAKRDLIIEKAQEALERFGLRKTTMEDIARGCGFRKASLYYYFKNKEEIVAEMIRRFGLEINERIRRHAQEADTATEAFRAIFCKKDMENPRLQLLLKLISEDFFGMLPHANAAFEEVDGLHQKLFRDVIEWGIRDGEFREVDVAATGKHLMECARALHVSALVEGLELMRERHETLEFVMELALRGLRKCDCSSS